jgi:hypothetical protein
VNLKIDQTPPTLTFGAASPPPNSAGWNNTDVRFSYTASDGGSGLSSSIPVSPLVLTAEGNSVAGAVTVTDIAGNSAMFVSPAVKIDKTPPVLTIPSTVSVNATGPSGAPVSYTASAMDALDPSPSLHCAPASGSVFPIGATTVACTAADRAGNSTTRSFQVTVRSALDQINDLIALLSSYNLGPPADSLMSKLSGIQSKLESGHTNPACNELNAFLNEVSAQTGKLLTVAQANQLTAAANQIRAVLGC